MVSHLFYLALSPSTSLLHKIYLPRARGWVGRYGKRWRGHKKKIVQGACHPPHPFVHPFRINSHLHHPLQLIFYKLHRFSLDIRLLPLVNCFVFVVVSSALTETSSVTRQQPSFLFSTRFPSVVLFSLQRYTLQQIRQAHHYVQLQKKHAFATR